MKKIICGLLLTTFFLAFIISCSWKINTSNKNKNVEIIIHETYYDNLSQLIVEMKGFSDIDIVYTTDDSTPNHLSKKYKADKYKGLDGNYYNGVLINIDSSIIKAAFLFPDNWVSITTEQKIPYSGRPQINNHGYLYNSTDKRIISVSCHSYDQLFYRIEGENEVRRYNPNSYRNTEEQYCNGILVPSNRNIYVFSYSKGKAMGIASLSIPSTPLMLRLGQFDIESSIIEINGDNDSNIYFTTDGTAPNSSSKLYSSFVNDYICTDGIKRNGIKVKNSDIIKSIAINSFDIKSKITSTLYYSWNKYTGFNSPINGYSIWKTTNQGVSNSYAVKKVTFSSYGDVTIYIRSSSDINKDYVMISKLNPTEIPQNIYSVSCNNYIYGSKTGYADLSYYTPIKYNVKPGDFLYVVFVKNSNVNRYDDSGYILLPNE